MRVGGAVRITKDEWYRLGGFSNPNLYRKHNGRNWEYWYVQD